MLFFPLSNEIVSQSLRPEELMIASELMPPHPWALAAAQLTMQDMRRYLLEHANSELHRQGKMFGVLVVEKQGEIGYLRAFSAMLDGNYHHEGYVPPIYDISRPDGYFKMEEARISAINVHLNQLNEKDSKTRVELITERKQRSQALQRWMFAQYRMLNALGQERDLLELFANEKTILSEEDYFGKNHSSDGNQYQPFTNDEALATNPLKAVEKLTLPPSGTGECCAPKLLQVAFREGMQPLALAEFWVGAPSRTEVRKEECFYPPCVGKCKPILKHMLSQTKVAQGVMIDSGRALAQKIEIVYEDQELMVVNKPAGLLSQPGKGKEYSLLEWAIVHTGHAVWLAHRLDQDTSGLLVLAKTTKAHQLLQNYFLHRNVKKRYEAILEAPSHDQQIQDTKEKMAIIEVVDRGLPIDKAQKQEDIEILKEGRIELPLLPDPYDRPRQMVNFEHGKVALTNYSIRTILSDARYVVDLFPETGRTHQLRVHCAHPLGLGCPIQGDRLYGHAGERLMLHAAEISFPHPITTEMMHFVSPAPFLI